MGLADQLFTVPNLPDIPLSPGDIGYTPGPTASGSNPTVKKTMAELKAEAKSEAHFRYYDINLSIDTDDTDLQDHARYASIVAHFDAVCEKIAKLFFETLGGILEALIRIYELLESLQKDVDNTMETMPDFPSIPSISLPEITIPTLDTDELACPFAECLGLPALPVMKFPTGLPSNPTPEIQAAYDEWTAAMDGYTDRFKEAAGHAGKVAINNAKKMLENLPQNILNGMVDAVKAQIFGLISGDVLDTLDAQIACIINKYPNMAQVYEILLYQKLRAQIEFDSNNDPVVNLSGRAQEVLGEFQNKISNINGKVADLGNLTKSGSGATDLGKVNTKNPLEAIQGKIF